MSTLYACPTCHAEYATRAEAEACAAACQSRLDSMRLYREGKITELQLAESLGLNVSTPAAQAAALRSIRNATATGTMKQATGTGSVTYLGTSLIHGGGRVQVPVKVRELLGVTDGAPLHFYLKNGEITVKPEEARSDWNRGIASYMGREKTR